MPHPVIQAHFRGNIKAAIDRAQYVSAIEHQGLKGQFREIFASDLLEPLLPEGFGIGRGKIIDSTGNESAECDVIVYNKNIMPPILFDYKTGLFPVEACIYAIEVKSVLTSTEMKDTIHKFKQLWTLKPLKNGDYVPRPVIFAFGSDLKASSKLDLAEVGKKNPECLISCVVGKGYHYWHPENGWMEYEIKGAYDEVLGFLAGFSNSLITYTKHRTDANFGNYFYDK